MDCISHPSPPPTQPWEFLKSGPGDQGPPPSHPSLEDSLIARASNPHPIGTRYRCDEGIAQTHATSSEANLQPTHMPVKSRGSPVGVQKGHEQGSASCAHIPPPPPVTQGTVTAGPCEARGRGPGPDLNTRWTTAAVLPLSGLEVIMSELKGPLCELPGYPQSSTHSIPPPWCRPALCAHPRQREPAARRPSSCWAMWRLRGRSGTQLLPAAS